MRGTLQDRLELQFQRNRHFRVITFETSRIDVSNFTKDDLETKLARHR